jgi:acyl transferase domain-containing protein
LGYRVDWKPLLEGAALVDLPTYAFQREVYWVEPQEQEALSTGSTALDADLWTAISTGKADEVGDVLGLPEADRENLPTLISHLASWRQSVKGTYSFRVGSMKNPGSRLHRPRKHKAVWVAHGYL